MARRIDGLHVILGLAQYTVRIPHCVGVSFSTVAGSQPTDRRDRTGCLPSFASEKALLFYAE